MTDRISEGRLLNFAKPFKLFLDTSRVMRALRRRSSSVASADISASIMENVSERSTSLLCFSFAIDPIEMEGNASQALR